MINYTSVTALCLTAILTFIAIFLVLKYFPKFSLVDKPEKYGHKRKAVPYPAGIIIPIIFFLLAFLVISPDSGLFKPLIGFGIASFILLIVSFIDDLNPLSPIFRLFVQIIVALIIVAFGVGIAEVRSPIGEILYLDFGSFMLFGKTVYPIADSLAVLWIMFMMNAMNWLDGVSGLTSSISTVASIILSISAYVIGQPDASLLFLILALICFIFFLFDLEPLKILMGDSGSMFLGFALAVFTIIAGGKVTIAMIVLFPPLFDLVWTIGRRLLNGVSPFKGDYEHLHHKLLYKLKDRRKVVIAYISIVSLFGFTALYFQMFGKLVIVGILIVFMTVLELFLQINHSDIKR